MSQWQGKISHYFNTQQAPAPVLMNVSTNFPWIPLYMMNYCFQVVWTGTTGTFKLQASADPFVNGNAIALPDDPKNPVRLILANPPNPIDIGGSSVPVVAAGSNMWLASAAPYNFIRLVYTSVGGAGSITSVVFNQKGPV
jgi:hypothetical protein